MHLFLGHISLRLFTEHALSDLHADLPMYRSGTMYNHLQHTAKMQRHDVYQLMQSNALPVPILNSPAVAPDGSHLHLVFVHRL